MTQALLQNRHLAAGRRGLWLPLAICLLLAQMLWFTHQVQHQLHHDRGVCTTCLGLAGVHAPVSTPQSTGMQPQPGPYEQILRLPGTSRPTPPGYQSRAPPRIPS